MIAGLALLGIFCGWVDNRYARQVNVVRALLFAYIGSILVFWTLTADSGSPLAYFFCTGAPLIALALIPQSAPLRSTELPTQLDSTLRPKGSSDGAA